jgi:hypothetical protein
LLLNKKLNTRGSLVPVSLLIVKTYAVYRAETL